jgi:hypothetical protein
MYLRLTLVALLASIAGSTAAVAQQPRPTKFRAPSMATRIFRVYGRPRS